MQSLSVESGYSSASSPLTKEVQSKWRFYDYLFSWTASYAANPTV